MTRVAIIGAGPSGLSQLRAFATARDNESVEGTEIPDIVCYEKQSDWGGLWNYNWRTGLDENGEPVHASMYRYLWSNGPKECLEFIDYSFEDHFGRPIGSFPPRPVLADYIKGRAEKSNIRELVRFNTSVRDVSFDQATDQFTIVSHDHVAQSTTNDLFDYVIVASGHFSFPNMPEYPGYDTFPGRIIHAHDYRDATEFSGQNVLVMGASYSAEDIASQCWKYGAASVTCTSRNGPMGFDWPEGITEKPIITHLEGRTAHFTDGTSTEIDAIISCTGYKHHFPFMADDLKLHATNRLATEMLYRGVIFQPNNKLMYLGMQDQWYTFNMFDVQAWYARDVIMGRITLPSQGEQAQWIADFAASEDDIADDYGAIDFQGAYTRDLMEQTDYPNFDTGLIDQTFKNWKKHKKESIMGYRDNGHQSPVTGTVAPAHHTSWVEALDDSLETFLG